MGDKTKKFVTKTDRLVFISEVDREKLLEIGDFIAPEYGYYSIIQTSNKKKLYANDSSKYVENFNATFEIPYAFTMYRGSEYDKWYVYETFNKDNNRKYQLISIKHNIFATKLDVIFTENDDVYTYDKLLETTEYDVNINLNSVSKIIVNLVFRVYNLPFLSYKTYNLTLIYPKPFTSDRIKCLGDKSIYNPEFFVYDIQMPPGKVRYDVPDDHIYNSSIQNPVFPSNKFQLLELLPRARPMYTMSYYYDDDTGNYVVFETFDSNDSGSILMKLEHNFCSTYLDTTFTYDDFIMSWTRETHIPKNDFENCINPLSILKVWVTFMYAGDKSSEIVLYKYPKRLSYHSHIKSLGDKEIYIFYARDINYISDITYYRQGDHIPNQDTNDTWYEIPEIIWTRVVENVFPQRT